MKWLCLPLLCLLTLKLCGQTRLFVSAGTNTFTQFTGEPSLNPVPVYNFISAGADNQDKRFAKYWRLGFTMENRLYGPYYWLTGIKINQAGYKFSDLNHTSSLKSTYVSIPMLLRVNLSNANTLYIDLGLMENILLDAQLKETAYQYSGQGNIARSLSRLSTNFYIELGFNYRRWGVSAFLQSNAFGSSKDFSGNGNVPQGQSYFQLYFQNFYYQTRGINLTYRIR